MDSDYTNINWTYMKTRYRGVEHNGVVYKLLWAPNTLADDIVCALKPLPSTTAPGLCIEGNDVTAMDAATAAALQKEIRITPETIEANELILEAEYEQETAAAVASPIFQSLPVVSVGPDDFAKRPRSAKEIANLVAAQGEPHIVQLVGRSAKNEVVFKRFGVCLREAWWDETARRRRDFPSIWVDQWCIDIAFALSRLHAKGILHHDLNPNNVLQVNDRAVICDLEAGPFTQRPPEIFMGDVGKYDKRSDMFLFGLLLWSINNRNMPRGEVWKVLTRNGTFGSVMGKCLQVDPSKRPTILQAYEEMKALFHAKHGKHAKAPPPPM